MIIRDLLNRAAEEAPDAVALRYKKQRGWETRSYAVLRERAWHAAEILHSLGIGDGHRVAIYRENSPEWHELYYGITALGAIAVPIDVKMRAQEIAHIFHDGEVRAVFASARFSDGLADILERLPMLQHIILLDGAPEADTARGAATWHAYDNLWEKVSSSAVAAGRAFDGRGPQPDAPASFIYTSGTTGRPKGAVLTHQNFLSNVEGVLQAIDFRPTDNIALILPLHHSFAFTTSVLLTTSAQCQVTLIENLRTIQSNMEETAPTVLLAVPLLLEKILARVQGTIQAKPLSRWMVRLGLAKVIGRRVNAGFGGALRLMVSGGAPISPSTLHAWSRLGFCIIEGYGITETAPVLSVNTPGQARVGTVGRPLHNVEIRIKDPTPEGVGEIVARGPNVMAGYHNNPEETEKVLVDGWYHTGDLGHFDKQGYLVVSGRKKSLIVNREGKNIYPEEVEQQVLKSPYVLECLAIGYREPGEEVGERVGMIVVPDQEYFDAREDEEGLRLSDREMEERVREEVRKQLKHLSDYKRPRRIEVRFGEFEKTTTQKIKRYLYAIDTTGR